MDPSDSQDESFLHTSGAVEEPPDPDQSPRSEREDVGTTSNNNSVSVLTSPARKRARVITLNLSSSSLKKRKFKPGHCRFCCRIRSRTDLERHLKESEMCCTLYFRELRVRSLDAVLTKLFPCLGCDKKGNFRLAYHLRQNHQCFEIYKEKFNVQDIESLSKKLRSLSRQSQPSRQNLNRRLENEKAQSKRSSNKTISEAVNDYKRHTALSNWRYCCRCGGNFLESGVREIDQTSPEFESMKLAEKPDYRRMNKYFLCLVCSQSNLETVNSDIVTRRILELKGEGDDGEKVLIPNFDRNLDQSDGAINESIRRVLVPSNMRCLELIELENIRPEPMILQKVYKCSGVNVELLSAMYVTQLSKFKTRKLYAERFLGTIAEIQEKKLSHVKPIVDDSDIRGSDTWEINKRNGLLSRFRQFGDCCVEVEIWINFDNIETIATSFLIQKMCISVSFLGDQNYDLQTKYFLHDHDSDTDCNPDCNPSDLQDLLQHPNVRNKSLGQQFNPVFIASVYQKLHYFVEFLVKLPSFDLHSEEYSFDIEFGVNDAKIVGFLWPKACGDFSQHKSESSLAGRTLDESNNSEAELVNLLTKSLLTTVDRDALKHKLKMSEEEVTDLVNLIMKLQLDFEIKFPVLPSLETSFKFLPPADKFMNIRRCERLLHLIQQILLNLPRDDKRSLSVTDWLGVLFSNTECEVTNDSVSIKFESENIIFQADDRLRGLMDKFGVAIGLYQYSITCATDKWDEDKVVMQKNNLIESFIHPYDPTLLRALRAKVCVNQLCGMTDVDKQTKIEDEGLVEGDLLLESHNLVSVLQLYSLIDANKIKEVNSSPIEYVNCREDQPVHFRKIQEKNDNCFELLDEGKFFELLGSNIIRHRLRMNGQHLILAEVATMYDYSGKSKSAEIYDIYQNNLTKIPNSTTNSIIDDKIVLPSLILCQNQQVMKLRKHAKVLSFPIFDEESDDYKLSKVMLFYPTVPGAVITKEDVPNFFYSTPEDGPVDAKGDRLSYVEINERYDENCVTNC